MPTLREIYKSLDINIPGGVVTDLAPDKGHT